MSKPVFIVGANRSGTTLLRLLLNAHSEIAVPDELVYFRGAFFSKSVDNWKITPLDKTQYEWLVDDFLERNRETLSPLDVDKLADQILDRGWSDDAGGDMKLPYEYTLEQWAAAHGKSRWGEKTPGNLFYVRDIVEMFPDAMFIYLVRDPRAGVLSMQKASIYSTDVVINALNRRYYLTKGLRLLERVVSADQRMVLRYEDLLEDPEAKARELCAFLDLPFEDDMLRFHESARQYMNPRAARDINPAANRPILVGKADTWRKEMTPRECAIVEAICGDAMREFGYELSGQSVPLRDWTVSKAKELYWRLQMAKHRRFPQYQVMHGVMPKFRSSARAGKRLGER